MLVFIFGIVVPLIVVFVVLYSIGHRGRPSWRPRYRAVRTPIRLNKMREPLGPLSSVDLAALMLLCNLKKVIRRDDGYGTGSETLISTASAAMLKRRNFAVTGWSREMYPTKIGHAFVAGREVK